MMFDSSWPYLTRERAVVLILALVGLGFLLFQVNQSHQPRMSLWGGTNPWGGGEESTGLSGVFQQTGQGLNGAALQPAGGNQYRNDTGLWRGFTYAREYLGSN